MKSSPHSFSISSLNNPEHAPVWERGSVRAGRKVEHNGRIYRGTSEESSKMQWNGELVIMFVEISLESSEENFQSKARGEELRLLTRFTAESAKL
jgi:hypothetical protein